MEKLLIIDGNSIVNRAFYALPLLTNQFGEFSNAVYGFSNILTKSILEYKPKYIAVAFDFGKKTFRNDIYADYKGKRKGMPEELAVQMPILKELLNNMNIKYFEKNGIEADDIIGTISKQENVEKIILSGDRDLFQLIDDNTTVFFTKKGISEVEKVDREKLKELMGLTPSQIVEFKALRGDSSDNIPGVSGIGDKTAMALLEEFETVDNIYSNLENLTKQSVKEKLENGKDMAEISKRLATIDRNVNLKYKLDDLTYTFPYNEQVFEFFKRYDFKSLMRRHEIFAENIQEQVKPNTANFENVKIESIDKLEEVIKYIKEEGRIAFDFTNGLKIACSPNFEYSFNEEITMFSSTLTLDEALKHLAPIFEAKNILKICYDLKKHKHILDNYNINISNNAFDIAIARYVLTKNTKVNELPSPVYYFNEVKALENEMKEFGVDDLFEKIEMPLVNVLFDMEKNGILIDTNELEQIKVILSEELEQITSKIYDLAGETFKINSPKVLMEILFDKLGLVLPKNVKKSTSVEVLVQIEDQHEIISQILRYRKVQKLLTTYVEPFSEIAKQNAGYIHSTFSQTQTSTGRLASSDPNLQNLPIRDEEGKHLRKIFISRFKDGNLVSADYNQIELRLMAHYSQDENLLRAYAHGDDIHASTAAYIFDKPISEITASERRVAKTVNFGIIYGISEYGLSQNLNTSVQKAKTYIERYFYTFPGVKRYMNECVETAKKTGYAKTLFGRIRFIPELQSDNKALNKFGERVALNMPLQGTASDIIKLAMTRVYNRLKTENLESNLVLQIHDELVVDCPKNEVEKVENILSEEMTGVINLTVKLPVAVSHGKTLMECK